MAMYLWKDSRLHLRITRPGILYVIVMAVVGMLGVYTNNNLLHAVFGLMIGLLLVSGWVSRASLQSLEPVRVEEGTLFARFRGGLRLRLSDSAPKRVRCLEIHVKIPNCLAEPVFFPGGKSISEPLAALKIRPEKRGLLEVKSVELRTSYPFGFLEKVRIFPVSMSVSVSPYPAGHEMPEGGSGDFSEPTPKSGYSSPIGARPFVPGDSTSRIHWKRTAQRGEPWVRLMEGDRPKGLVLELDLGAWEPGTVFERELERLSGAILQARLHKLDTTLTIFGKHGRIDAVGHIPAWKALATVEAEALAART